MYYILHVTDSLNMVFYYTLGYQTHTNDLTLRFSVKATDVVVVLGQTILPYSTI